MTKSNKAIKFRWPRSIVFIYCIILCVALLASFTMGWYVGSAAVKDNRIVSTFFRLDATVQDAAGTNVSLQADGEGWKATLPAGGTYKVNLTCNKRTTGHGRCVIALNDDTYQTVILGKCGSEGCSVCGNRETVSFTVTIPAGKAAQISLQPHWGSQYAIAGTNEISANAEISLAH